MNTYKITFDFDSKNYGDVFHIYTEKMVEVSTYNSVPDTCVDDWNHVDAAQSYLTALPDDAADVYIEGEGWYSIQDLQRIANECESAANRMH